MTQMTKTLARRLPQYLDVLSRLRAQGRDVVSLNHLARVLSISPEQVRAQLEMLNPALAGQIVLPVAPLMKNIRQRLDLDERDTFVVGDLLFIDKIRESATGRHQNMNLIAFFSKANANDAHVPATPVLPFSKLENLAVRLQVKQVIVAAQIGAESMIQTCRRMGFTLIWHFDGATLNRVGPQLTKTAAHA